MLPARKVWRGHLAIRRSTGIKKEYLSMVWSMEMAGALPQFGNKVLHKQQVSQKHLGAMQGIRRETVNRRQARFATPSSWTDERRAAQSDRMRVITEAKGRKLRSKERRSLAHVATFLHRAHGWGESNHYAQLPEKVRPVHTKGRDSMGEDHTEQAMLLAAVFGEKYFDPEAHVNGYKEIDGLLWHPNLPDPQDCACAMGQRTLDTNQPCPHCEGTGTVFRGSLPDFGRCLATLLILKRIKDEKRDAGGKVVKHRNMLIVTQEELANDLGMDVNTLAKYEAKLEKLMIIRTVPGEVHRDASGAVTKRDPHKILWILDKLLDQELAEREASRFAAASRAAVDRGEDRVALQSIAKQFSDFLRSWTGKEHSLQAFYNEMRRRLTASGVRRELAGALFPLARE